MFNKSAVAGKGAAPKKNLPAFWRQAWEELDFQDENETVQSEPELTQLISTLKTKREVEAPPEEDETQKKKRIVGKDYKGPKIQPPLTVENIVSLISFFQNGGKLHYKYAHWLVTEASALLSSKSIAFRYLINARTTHFKSCFNPRQRFLLSPFI